jgi:quinol monooxygenase YgiN
MPWTARPTSAPRSRSHRSYQLQLHPEDVKIAIIRQRPYSSTAHTMISPLSATSCLSSQKRNADKTVKRPGCTIIGTVVAKPEKREELLRILIAQVAPTRAEPGCVSYDFHCDAQDPCVFVFYENFRSRDALDKHLQMPYLRPLMDRVDELCAEPIVIRHLHMLVDRAS